MKIDRIRITAEITRELGSKDETELTELFRTGERVVGLVEQFSWMPFIVTGRDCSSDGASGVTFHLLMVSK